MTFRIRQNEATAARRRVPLWLVTSDGTSPDTGASNDSIRISINGGAQTTPNAVVSAVSANAGRYYFELPQANVATLGSIVLIHDQGAFIQGSEIVEVYDPLEGQAILSSTLNGTQAAQELDLGSAATSTNDFYNNQIIMVEYADGQRASELISDYTGSGNSAWLRAALDVTAESGATFWIFPGISPIDLSTQSIGLVAANHPGVTIPTVTTITNTVSANAIQVSGDAGAADNLEAAFDGTGYDSNLTVLGVSGNVDGTVASVTGAVGSVTGAVGSVTGAVGSVTGNVGGDVVGDVQGGVNSAVTVGLINANVITASAYATDAGQEIADRVLLRNVAGGDDSARSVGQALYALRNRVEAGASVLTVYDVDDTTSAWTASLGTGTNTITEINPA